MPPTSRSNATRLPIPSRTIDLTDHLDQLVESLVSSGRYSDASEVMRDGLRLLERQALEDEQKLATLRGLASEALDRGEGTTLEDEQSLNDHIAGIGHRASGRAAIQPV